MIGPRLIAVCCTLFVGAAASAKPETLDDLFGEPPSPGHVEEMTQHEEPELWSFWLSNGIRVFVMPHGQGAGMIEVSVQVSGGRLLEGPGEAGMAEAAGAMLMAPETGARSAREIREALGAMRLQLSGQMAPDAIQYRLRATPETLEAGFRVMHAVITDPGVDQANLRRWKQVQRQRITMSTESATAMFARQLGLVISPERGGPMHPLDDADIAAIEAEALQSWMRTAFAERPIEIAIVGDVEVEPTMELVRRYFGSLPQRDRPSPEALRPYAERIAAPGDAVHSEAWIESDSPRSMALAGFRGLNAADQRTVRALHIAQYALGHRLDQELRLAEKAQAVVARSMPGEGAPSLGVFFLGAMIAPGEAADMADTLHAHLDRFATEGPSEGEMEIALQAIENELDGAWMGHSFWAHNVLGSLTRRGLPIEGALVRAEDYKGITDEEVRDAFAALIKPERRVTVVIETIEPFVESEPAGPSPTPAEAREESGDESGD